MTLKETQTVTEIVVNEKHNLPESHRKSVATRWMTKQKKHSNSNETISRISNEQSETFDEQRGEEKAIKQRAKEKLLIVETVLKAAENENFA